MSSLDFRFISTGTSAYEQMIDLRMRVLLQPIGIPRSYINPEKESNDLLIGAYVTDHLVGCCILTHRNHSTIQLRQMAVDDTLQKTGVGTALLQLAEEVARQKGYEILLMHARDSVLPFYKKCGYEITGEPFSEVGTGHHIMQKSLLPTG